MRAGVVGIERQCLTPRRDGIREAVLLHLVDGSVVEPVEVGGGSFDALQPALGNVEKFRDIGGAIARGGVVDQDGGAVVAVFVDVGEVELCIEGAALRGEHQPAAVRREAVPGVHHLLVGIETPRDATLRRHDI